VEEQRTRLIGDLSPWVPAEHEAQAREEFEVGMLDFLLSATAAPDHLKKRVRTLKRTRNEMAHCRPLPYPSLLDLSRLENL
jgi:hypothetical protein